MKYTSQTSWIPLHPTILAVSSLNLFGKMGEEVKEKKKEYTKLIAGSTDDCKLSIFKMLK